MIKLGSKVICKISGFEGIAVSKIECLYGSRQFQIFATSVNNSKSENCWLEEKQLKLVKPKNPKKKHVVKPKNKPVKK